MDLKDEALKDKILNQIDQVLKQGRLAGLYLTVTNMFERIYGPHSPQLRLVETLQKQVYDGQGRDFAKTLEFSDHLRGCLHTLASEIREGLIVNIQSEARGEVLGNFLVLAREAIDAEWDAIDVPSVNAIIAFTETFIVQRFSSPAAADNTPDPPVEA